MKTASSLPGIPDIGSTTFVGEQRFACVAVQPYVTQDGRRLELSVWEAPCAECGQPFRYLTPRRKSPVRVDRRRCDLHRQPGKRVGQHGARAARQEGDSRAREVWSLDEVGRVIGAWEGRRWVDAVRSEFPGAQVQALRLTPRGAEFDWSRGDEIPFGHETGDTHAHTPMARGSAP